MEVTWGVCAYVLQQITININDVLRFSKDFSYSGFIYTQDIIYDTQAVG